MVERKNLHPRNKHSAPYDFERLMTYNPALKQFIIRNPYNDALTIDFFNPRAVRALNTAILKADYGLTYWNIPKGALCPPIPGRADYIHYIADLKDANGVPLRDKACHALDVGVGSNCIYSILGCREYNWTFVGADINDDSLANARKIVTCNPVLAHRIDLRKQTDPHQKFHHIIQPDEYFDVTVCNPPFHESEIQAERTARLKQEALRGARPKKAPLNFGGVSNELWCDGGELRFLTDMIVESKDFATQVGWFTTLVSKRENLSPLYSVLKATGVSEYKTILMSQGTKTSRLIAWRF